MARGFTKTVIRAIEREQRERAKALARQQKELAKKAALNAAHAEVERYQELLTELVTLHAESSDPIDWLSLAARLPPHAPSTLRPAEAAARRERRLLEALGHPSRLLPDVEGTRRGEDAAHADAQQQRQEKETELAEVAHLARRVLRYEQEAHLEVLRELDLSDALAGSVRSVEFDARSAGLLEVTVRTGGVDGLPAETPSVTATGKLTKRATPRKELAALYQEHAVSACLRIGREVLAAVPAEVTLLHAVESSADGQEAVILSLVFERPRASVVDFACAAANEVLGHFRHRIGTPARSGGLSPVPPFGPDEVAIPSSTRTLKDLVSQAESLLAELKEGAA